jgi:hypothetical protein
MIKPLIPKNISTPDAPNVVSQSGLVGGTAEASDSSKEWWKYDE